MKDKIIEILKSKDYKPLTAHQLSIALHIGNHDDYKQLEEVLKEMIEDCIVFKSKTDHFYLPENVGLKKGVLSLNKKGFGFVTIDSEEEDIYVSAKNLNGAMNKDLVLLRVLNGTSGHSIEGEIAQIAKRGQTKIVGLLASDRRGYYIIADDSKIDERIIINHRSGAMEGHKVLVELTQYEPFLRGDVVEIIGHVNDPGVDILSIVYKHDLAIEFPKEVMSEVEIIEDQVDPKDKIGRVDLTNQVIVTIDSDDAKDLDDAVQVTILENGNYELGVHIADVSHYVAEFSSLDMEASQRGTSVYLVDRVIPMLPHRLSNGICSLNPKVDRLTLSCVMEITPAGEVVSHKIFDSFIKTTERMTYKNVNKILADDGERCNRYAKLVPMFKDMERLAAILRDKRESQGSIDFDVNEAKVLVDENGKAIDVVLRERGTSEKIIEEFMLLANETVAEHFYWMDIPFVYRIHESPKLKKLKSFANTAKILGFPIKGMLENVHPKDLQAIVEATKDLEEHSLISTLLLRSMQKARYSVECEGHYGLAFQYYTHFTSPIRRYPDLLVHRLIHTYLVDQKLDGETIVKYNELLPNLVEHSSNMEITAVMCERDVDDMKKAEYMQDHIGEEFEGIISSITGFGMFVELPNTIEGLVHISELKDDYYEYVEERMEMVGKRTGKSYKMSDKVKVQVKAASKEEATIDFVVVSKENKAVNNKPVVKNRASKREGKYGKQPFRKERSSNTKNNKTKPQKPSKIKGRGAGHEKKK